MDHLPADTDFYGSGRAPHPGVVLLSPADPRSRVLPIPVFLALENGAVRISSPDELPEATIPAVEKALQDGEAAKPVRLILLPPGDGASASVETALAAAGVPVPDHREGYAIAPHGEGLLLASRSSAGLRHGAETLRRLVRVRSDGELELPSVRVRDWPACELRFLGGWALWRAHGLREAIDLAAAMKANRVLYNAWGWTPADRLWKEDAILAEYARARGIELVFELRRMSFGREARIADPKTVEAILETLARAAEHGFRSFGFLFDDVPWETAGDECVLVRRALSALEARLRPHRPEFFTCPQHYWFPGQMDSAWKGRAGPGETRAQREYLETYGRELPPDVHVYIANYWGDHPAAYQSALREGFSDLVRRQPVFFDNQIINDYRSGAVLPFALHDRPLDLGEHYAGYCLNAARPLEAYAAAVATALAYAWNPAGHDPGVAMGAALRWLHGPSGARVERVAQAINLLRDLANEWGGGFHTALSHHATIWRLVREGRAHAGDLARWKESLGAARRSILDAIEEPAPAAPRMGLEGLAAIALGTLRLERDLDLFSGYLTCAREAPSPPALAAFQALSRELVRNALRSVAAILPPAPNLAPLLDDPRAIAEGEAQGWSWVEYFHASTRRTLEEVRSQMLESLERERG